MIYAAIIVFMAVISRLSGSGFGARWNVPWLPEAFFSIAIGVTSAWAVDLFFGFAWALPWFIIALLIAYAGMQAATWGALRWESHTNPNTERSAKIKPVVDWIANRFGWYLGDEGYAWVWMGVKGFIIGLPIGGIPLAILWPLGYEIGSHAKGRMDKWIHPHTVAELAAGAGAGVAIVIFIEVVKALN